MDALTQGTAAEHLVCADLLLQGHFATLAEAGMPYDLLVDVGTKILKVQVKSAMNQAPYCRPGIYRFGLRKGKHALPVQMPSASDIYAFVALDKKLIAYVPVGELVGKDGHLVQCLEIRDKDVYQGRMYSNGTQRKLNWGKIFQDCNSFQSTISNQSI